jgi:NADH-quinone oxidoreductase subunit E
MEYIGDMLGMAYIRVLEVATFYTMFQLSPVGSKAHIQVCGTTPCMLRGAEDLKKVCQKKIHAEPHHLNADGTLSWEEVECLGACVNAPMVQVWKDTYEDLTPETLEKLIDDWQSGRKATPGPQNGRQHSMALGGASTLTDPSLYSGQRTFKRLEPPPPPAAAEPPVAAAAPPPPPTPAPPAAAPAVKAAPVAAALKSEEKPAAALAKKEPPRKYVDLLAEQIKEKKAKKGVPAPAVAKASKPKAKPVETVEPERLAKPRGGKGDDLELIWGVGPGMARMLNKMGIWHFDQIASWSATQLKWVDENLKGFKGRASRDEWVPQAKKLAKGWRPDSDVGEKPARKK